MHGASHMEEVLWQAPGRADARVLEMPVIQSVSRFPGRYHDEATEIRESVTNASDEMQRIGRLVGLERVDRWADSTIAAVARTS